MNIQSGRYSNVNHPPEQKKKKQKRERETNGKRNESNIQYL